MRCAHILVETRCQKCGDDMPADRGYGSGWQRTQHDPLDIDGKPVTVGATVLYATKQGELRRGTVVDVAMMALERGELSGSVEVESADGRKTVIPVRGVGFPYDNDPAAPALNIYVL